MKPVFLSLFCSAALAAAAHAAFLIQPNDVVAICGDSITEQRLYSGFVEDYLLMCQPTPGQRIVQLGWGGEQVPGFHGRLASDLFPFKPTVVTTCYGMNDGAYVAATPQIVERYRKAMTDTVDDLKKGGVRAIVVGTPGCVDSTTFKRPVTTPDVYNENLRQLGEAARDVAEKAGVAFTDVHAPMMDAMGKAKAAFGPDYPFVDGDGVHPGPNGHLLMTYAMLKGLGCDGAIGTITLDLGAGQATGTPGQKIVSTSGGTVQVESTRYPFCFAGDPAKPEPTLAAIVRFTTFNEELNRYLLVVKGLKGSKGKVTWSSADGQVAVSQEFPAAELEKGVNLAAAFVGRNPFSGAFDKVNAAVQLQQTNEVVLVKLFMHNVPLFKPMAPGSDASLEQVTASGMEHDAALFNAAAALVVPVQHSIKVEAVP